MRRIVAILLMLVLLCGCAAQPVEAAPITVSLALPEGCIALRNGLRIQSGQDAVFELVLEDGYEFSAVDYDGAYSVESKLGILYVTLKSVCYPTLANVKLTNRFCTIHYEPNGADAAAKSVVYDTGLHLRPNTDNGAAIRMREGYTLTGWNTKPDGTGTAVGLGSRVSVPDGELTLYAQWSPWSAEADFTWEAAEGGVRITGYHGMAEVLTVPARLDGMSVTVIGSGAFSDCTARQIILPPTVKTLERDAFVRCEMTELTFFDNIEVLGDLSFRDCPNFSTIHINAVEAPWGYDYRRESCLADKIDILIEARGKKKMVFYGGCSMWYNLDGATAQEIVGEDYQVINLGLNGVMNSSAQVQILTPFLEEGDIFFHTPELSSQSQMMQRTEMINHDRKLWSGLEYNYDLVSLLDIRTLPEFFDILSYWLSTKEHTSSYTDVYRDSFGNVYVDQFGCASFPRNTTAEKLDDTVQLDPKCFDPTGLSRLEADYQRIRARGAKVYVGHACINLDALPQEQQKLVDQMDRLFREHFGNMEGVTVVGSMADYLYHNQDFYDTNYHLLTASAHRNTRMWLDDLKEQMLQDGLWND